MIKETFDSYSDYDKRAVELSKNPNVIILKTYCDKENGVFEVEFKERHE